jgi:Glycosyl transferase family 2
MEAAHEMRRSGAWSTQLRTSYVDLSRLALVFRDAELADQLLELGADGSTSSTWRSALQGVFRPGTPRSFHHAGALLPFATAAALQRGELHAEQLASFLLRHPRAVLRAREALLLLHDAGPRRGPLRPLSRHLAALGVARSVVAERGSSPLAWQVSGAATASNVRGRVTVVMAAYNAANTIAAAIASVLNQTHRELELLVCDDASSDRTLEVARTACASDPRVRIFRSAANQGAYNIRNAAVELASGDFITFHDADDVSLPGRLATQLAAVTTTNAVGCITDWLRVRDDGCVVFFADGSAQRLSVVSLLVRTEALRAVGPYPSASFGADLDVLGRLEHRFGPHRLVRLREPWLLGLWSSHSITRTKAAEALEDGYKSPARRAYSELLYRRDELGTCDDEAIAAELRRAGNWRVAAPLERV